jgi:hypothetical protein
MSEAKFSPGPWSKDKYGCIKTADGKIVRAHGLALPCGRTPKDDVSFANTHLIAAAPTMYSALEEALDCLNDVSSGKGGWDYEAVIQSGEMLLAKARGESDAEGGK